MPELAAAFTTALSTTLDRVLAPVREFREWLEYGMPMPGSGTVGMRDRRRWREATSMDELCSLTVAWLSGEIGTQPGYYGRVDVDDDLAPGMATALIALNRMGFLTRCSQAGYNGVDPDDVDDFHWTQCAAVEGFASPSTVERLQAALGGTRFEIRAEATRPPDVPFVQGQVVTHLEGSPHTWFGGRLSAEEIELEFEGTSAAAVAAVQETLQVVIQDPTAGPNDLWTCLNAAAATAAAAAEVPASHNPTPPAIPVTPGPRTTAAPANRSRTDQDVENPTIITIGRHHLAISFPPA